MGSLERHDNESALRLYDPDVELRGVRDGKLWRLRIFETKVEALEAVRLDR